MCITIITYIIVALISFIIGWVMANYKHIQQRIKQLIEKERVAAELSSIKKQAILSNHLYDSYKTLNNELHSLRDINSSLKADLHEISTRLELVKLHTENKINQIFDNKKHLGEQFENLANIFFEKNNSRINEQNQQNIKSLLTPLREQIDIFFRQIQENFIKETHGYHSLMHEIHNMKQLNAQIVQETVNFTQALKGNNKIQGNWGEAVLTRTLEISGLRSGYEYEIQVNIETNAKSRVQPDVIIHLPQNKDVIIDAKMTLVAYERYFNARDELTRKSALQDHINSIRNHIRLLGKKDYQQLPGLNTLDYVLMFIPIEPAFLLALDKQPELITEALNNNIMLVSPTTLLVALRTISNFWRHEHLNHNTEHLAKHASKLYDKMRLFIEDMLSLGQGIERAQDDYHQAMKKLTSGRGNLLAQIEAFRSLGVEIKHKINPKLTKQAIFQDKL